MEPSLKTPSEDPVQDGTFAEGMLLLIPFHLLQIPMSFFVYELSFFLIGVTQLVYVVPLPILLNAKKERAEMMKGVAAAAAITFMVNATCTSIVFFLFK